VVAIVLGVMVSALPTAAVATDRRSAAEWDVLERVNRFRDGRGVPPLRMASGPRKVAGARSGSMIRIGYFGHVSPGGRDAGDLLRARGIRGSWGEVIGWTRGKPIMPASRWMVAWWKRSPKHRSLLLSRRYDAAGVGVAKRGARTIWTIVLVG
jgi:uncharacterized protein YkwD